MLNYLLVFIGAGLGGSARHAVNVAAARALGMDFPYGTLIVNVVGSFAMGLLIGIFAIKSDPGQQVRLFLTTGFLGGFTTFSTFTLDTITIWNRGDVELTVFYVLGSVVLSLGAITAALALVRTLA